MTFPPTLDVLVSERQALTARLEGEREQLELLHSLASSLNERITAGEQMLNEIEEALGSAPQLRLDDADLRLRGRHLAEVAVEVLERELGSDAEVHYKEWFQLLRLHGYLVAGKRPLDNFLAQLGRTKQVERLGRRSGMYRLRSAA